MRCRNWTAKRNHRKEKMKMATYEINFPALSTATDRLEDTISQLRLQMQTLDDIKENILSDKAWYGPNKSKFKQGFTEYQTALNELYKSAVDHYNKLVQITNEYKKAESNQ